MKVMMSQKEIDTIKKYLTSGTEMLEYGSGGSTLYFSQYVKKYYSIEHDKLWYNKMKAQVANIENIKTFFCGVKVYESRSRNVRIHATCWDELEKSERYTAFERYIRLPSLINKKFGAVLIDGRARPECAKFIYDFLEEEAYIFIHDYWREARKYYHVVEEKYKVVDHIKWGQSLVVLQKK